MRPALLYCCPISAPPITATSLSPAAAFAQEFLGPDVGCGREPVQRHADVEDHPAHRSLPAILFVRSASRHIRTGPFGAFIETLRTTLPSFLLPKVSIDVSSLATHGSRRTFVRSLRPHEEFKDPFVRRASIRVFSKGAQLTALIQGTRPDHLGRKSGLGPTRSTACFLSASADPSHNT